MNDDDLQRQVLEVLRERGPMGWTELRATIPVDDDDRAEGAVETLQTERKLRYSPGRGYVAV